MKTTHAALTTSSPNRLLKRPQITLDLRILITQQK